LHGVPLKISVRCLREKIGVCTGLLSCIFGNNVVNLAEGGSAVTVSFWTYIISTMGTWLVSFYIFGKSINHTASILQKALFVTWCLLWAFLFYLELPTLIMGVLFCGTSIALIWLMLKIKFDTVISAFLLSYGFSYVCYSIAALTIGLVFAPFLSAEEYNFVSLVDFNQPIYLLFYAIIAAFQLIIALSFFRIRRFKLGFPFLSGRYTVAVALVIAGIALVIITLIAGLRETRGVYRI
jgi:hypothetical protein